MSKPRRISELGLELDPKVSDLIALASDGMSKRTTLGSTLNASMPATFGNTTINGDLDVNGNLNVSTIISSSVLYDSGSTIFGNTLDDTHDFIGDASITGSLFISGATEFGGDLVPKTARGATLGTNERPFREIYVQSGSINIASDVLGDPNTSLSNEGGNILISAGGVRLLGSASFIAATGSFQYLSGSFTHVGSAFRTGDTIIVGDQEITGSLDVMGNINVASGSGFFYEGNKLFNRGQFYHTATLSGSANTAYPFQYNTTDTTVTNGAVYVDNTSRVYVKHTGIYNIQFSSQLRAVTNDPIEFSIWFAMTGSNIDNSNTDYSIAKVGGGGNMVAALNYLMPLSSGSYFEIYYSKTRADGLIEAKGVQTTPNRPATPSVILTVTQIA